MRDEFGKWVQPPIEAYEFVVCVHPGTRPDQEQRWAVAKVRLYGRSIYEDMRAIHGQYYSFPQMLGSKESALAAARKTAEEHREAQFRWVRA